MGHDVPPGFGSEVSLLRKPYSKSWSSRLMAHALLRGCTDTEDKRELYLDTFLMFPTYYLLPRCWMPS